MTTSVSDDNPNHAPVRRHVEYRLEGVHIRLRATRRVCGMGSVSAAAREFGIERSRWSNWENDLSIPPPHLLVKMRARFPHVCLNYIYAGDTNSVPPSTAAELRAVEASVTASLLKT